MSTSTKPDTPRVTSESTEQRDEDASRGENDGAQSKHGIVSRRVLALIVGIASVAVIILGIYFFLDKNDVTLKRNAARSENFQRVVSYEEVYEHDVSDDCWMVIHGDVYDFTEYAPVHPGGPEFVTDFCGADATRDYDLEHSEALLETVTEFLLGTIVAEPTTAPTPVPTEYTTGTPTASPTPMPSSLPSESPTPAPSLLPTLVPSLSPSFLPSLQPSSTLSLQPSSQPTSFPSLSPSTYPSAVPSPSPTLNPTATLRPTSVTPQPSHMPTTSSPTLSPTTSQPTTAQPTSNPTAEPTALPTRGPTLEPTREPTAEPTPAPTREPTAEPTREPTQEPTAEPTREPTAEPTEGVPMCEEQVYTEDDVAEHGSTWDCYYILYDVVYDFTDYIDEHPGGARRVFQECGTEATEAYEDARKHDEELLEKENMDRFRIGIFGTESGPIQVPC